jgi:hypothetical protein
VKIGLVDVDGHRFPNLALMKISAWHKNYGDTVEWAGSLEHYDVVYMAKVFTFTPDDIQSYQADEIVKGGTGYDLISKLPNEIESCYPDYNLYGIEDTAYGYLSRGCPRKCQFCIVAEKEGMRAHKVANLSQFWSGQKYIKLLDPNLLACPDWENLLGQLAGSGAWVDFTQGLDIRLMTDKKAAAINNVKYSMLRFAWDDPHDMVTYDKLIKYKDVWKGDFRRRRVYVLTNFNSSHSGDLFRVYALRELGYDPYIMIYDKIHAPKETRYLQRWVNNKRIFRTIKYFKDYDHTRG